MGSRNQDPSFSSVDPASPPAISTSVAHPARRYDYWLGGKDNFPADQVSGDAVEAAFPTIRRTVVENRRFLVRAVRLLAGELGIQQFLDIGTGIPTSPNVHEVAQSIAPESRVVYVDNDPIVLAHARALLRSGSQGATAYIDADLREADKILQHPDLLRTLDLSQPVALMLVAILHFIPDGDDPYGLVSHATSDFMPPKAAAAVDEEGAQSRVPFLFRAKKELARFLEGLDLMPPGIQALSEWRAESEPQPRPSAADIAGYAAVARIG